MHSSFILKHIKFRVHENPIVSQFVIVLYSTWHLTKVAIQLIEHKYSCALLHQKKKARFLIGFFLMFLYFWERRRKQQFNVIIYNQQVNFVFLGYLHECTGQLPHHEILQDIKHTSMCESTDTVIRIYTQIFTSFSQYAQCEWKYLHGNVEQSVTSDLCRLH